MKIKKSLAVIALCAIVGASLIPTTASAHHGGGGHRTSKGYGICTVANCHKSGNHSHSGTTYSSRCSSLGHDHHN